MKNILCFLAVSIICFGMSAFSYAQDLKTVYTKKFISKTTLLSFLRRQESRKILDAHLRPAGMTDFFMCSY